jgi:hypothetical protein
VPNLPRPTKSITHSPSIGRIALIHEYSIERETTNSYDCFCPCPAKQFGDNSGVSNRESFQRP